MNEAQTQKLIQASMLVDRAMLIKLEAAKERHVIAYGQACLGYYQAVRNLQEAVEQNVR